MPLPDRVVDLAGYDLLLSVDELGSIGRAAAAHGVSQPAASTRLRRLENQVGVALLERTARGARLTAAGLLVAGWARAVTGAAADLDAGIASLRAREDGHLRIAASLTVAEYLLPKWLLALRTAAPGTVPALSSGNSEEVAARVLAGSVHIGFIEGPVLPKGLRAKRIGVDELAVVVAPGHAWARRRRAVSGRELAATPLVSREPGSGTRLSLERALPGGPAEPLLEMSSTTAIKAAAMAGIGPAVLSLHTVHQELVAGTLVRVTVSDVDLHRELRAIWPAGQSLRGPARELLALAARR